MSIGGNMGCRQQQQPRSCPKCECSHSGALAGKTALPSARELTHVGMAPAMLPEEVPEAIAVAGCESPC